MPTRVNESVNRVHARGEVSRKPRFSISTAGKPMLALQLAVPRDGEAPPKFDAQGIPEPDFPWVSIQGTAAIALREMPVGTWIDIEGSMGTRFGGPNHNRHQITEIIAKSVGVMQGPAPKNPELSPKGETWTPLLVSDTDVPGMSPGQIREGKSVVAAFKSDETLTRPDAIAELEKIKRIRKSKHKNNKANRRAREYVAQLEQGARMSAPGDTTLWTSSMPSDDSIGANPSV
jgi:hypothetical protein